MPFEACESAMLGFHASRLSARPVSSTSRGDRARRADEDGAFDVRPRAPLLKTANFSGGNQQKIVLAREIERKPEDPAGRPADARRRHRRDRIHPQALVAQRDAGKAVLLVSVELDEIFALSDRIIVLCGGRITGERRPTEATRRALGLLMAGVNEREPHERAAKPLPAWADVALIPLVNVAARLRHLRLRRAGDRRESARGRAMMLVLGALGIREGIGYTLYYATSFIFTGLSVAICFHAGLFNIGTEGQAYIGGLGAALVACTSGFLPG